MKYKGSEFDMNIMFFLTPKSDVAYIYDDYSLRQTLEKMEFHRYAAIPIIDRRGHYVGTITEGDLLWNIKNEESLSLKIAEEIPIKKIKRRMDNVPVRVDSNMEDLITKATNQNFVPVIDDKNVFIGIITRQSIMAYFLETLDS